MVFDAEVLDGSAWRVRVFPFGSLNLTVMLEGQEAPGVTMAEVFLP
jgi:hypothetical protein